MLGIEVPPDQLIRPAWPVFVFLLIYTTVPWWQRRMGRAFLPIALVLLAAQAIGGSYVTLQSLVPPNVREFAAPVFMLRLWVSFQFLVLFVAWQYELVWAMIVGVTLCLLDAALAARFVHPESAWYPFYVTIVVARLVAVTGAGIGLGLLMKRQRQQRAALAEANHKLTRYAAATEQLAISHERNRLARELHDTLAHSLSSIKVQLTAADALWDRDPVSARRMLNNAMEATQDGLTEARRALQSLRASPLDDLGFVLALQGLAESTAARAGLQLDFDAPKSLDEVAPEVEQCVYRVAQEALTNVARHAHASRVQVRLNRADGRLTMTIADDGCGFDPAAVNGAHYGLKGMRERVEMMGGTLEVASVHQQGTTQGTTVRLEVSA
jgi:signal transduction histidine kinase